jgi:hypothetical protein
MSRGPWDLYVFRDARRREAGARAVGELVRDIAADRSVDALVRAGEIESALADLADADAIDAGAAARLTDALAAAVVGVTIASRSELARLASSLEVPRELRASPPEGFSYRALHPLAFAELASGAVPERGAGVVGVRGIGTTLSALVCAGIRARGGCADRRTIRSADDPFRRVAHLGASDVRWAQRHAARGSEVIVVDEGPTVGASALPAVAEALVTAGVARERITLLSTSAIDSPSSSDGLAFRARVASGAAPMPRGASTTLAPGEWRARFLEIDAEPPPCWPLLERAKALSIDGRRLYKFEGLGGYGVRARERAELLARSGFGPAVRDGGDGWVTYDVVAGRSCGARDLDEAAIDRIADYCAWRSSALALRSADLGELVDMLHTNVHAAFGRELPRGFALDVARPVLADARMHAFEWIHAKNGALVKADGVSHGDDALFPGPTDIAWDLAGAMVEWRMPASAADRLLRRYTQRSGDDARARAASYTTAYAVHRFALSTMASAAARDEIERARFDVDARRYARLVG